MNEQGVDAAAAGAVIFTLIYFGFIILYIVGLWNMFAKAGLPKWGV